MLEARVGEGMFGFEEADGLVVLVVVSSGCEREWW